MEFLHIFLITITLFSSFLIFLSNNPVHSVLFLIFTIINSSIILFLFNAEFLGLIFIIIYVGAIAILFLFVVMMLNVKIVKLNFLSFIPLITVLSFIGFFNILTLLDGLFTEYNFLDITSYNILIDNLSNIDVIGQSLYNYYISVFLIAGFILLIAMIGAICLTLKFSSIRKSQFSAFKRIILQFNTNKSFFAGLSVWDYWFQHCSSAVYLSPETATFVCVLGLVSWFSYRTFSNLFGSRPKDRNVPTKTAQEEAPTTTELDDVVESVDSLKKEVSNVVESNNIIMDEVGILDGRVSSFAVDLEGHEKVVLALQEQIKALTEELEFLKAQLEEVSLHIIGVRQNTANSNLIDSTLSEAAPNSSVAVDRAVHMVAEPNISTLFDLFYGLGANLSYAEPCLFIFV